MASNAIGNSGGRLYSFGNTPVLIDCNFIVDSTNGNGLGIRSLKGQGVANVYMNTTNSSLANQLALLTARQYGILGASAITTSGATTITGNVGLYPGTSITQSPLMTISGATNVANVAASTAQTQANAAFNAGQALGLAGTTIASELGGQTLTPGAYQFASGTAGISLTSGHSTLTLNGNGVYIIYTATTLLTGASGSTDLPVISLTGGAQAQNVYFIVGSSATINQSAASAGAIFNGNIIAKTSVTQTQTGSINGSVVALTGAVTLSAGSTIVTQALTPSVVGGPSNPAPGMAWVQLTNNYNRYLGGFSGFVSPTAGSTVAINSTALTVGNPYIIASVGHAAAGQATIAPVADVSGSLASTYFVVPDSYGNTFVIWFSVSGVGSAPLLGNPAAYGVPGLHYVQQTITSGSSAATIGAALVLTLENLPSGIANVDSFTASGTTTVTYVNTNTNPYHLPGPPQDGPVGKATGFALALTVDDHNLADWQAVGLPPGLTPTVGQSFIAKATGHGSSTGLAIAPGVSGINSVEIVGDPSASIAPQPQGGSANVGGWVLVQLLSNGVPTAPVNGSVCGMCFYVDTRLSPSNVNARNP